MQMLLVNPIWYLSFSVSLFDPFYLSRFRLLLTLFSYQLRIRNPEEEEKRNQKKNLNWRFRRWWSINFSFYSLLFSFPVIRSLLHLHLTSLLSLSLSFCLFFFLIVHLNSAFVPCRSPNERCEYLSLKIEFHTCSSSLPPPFPTKKNIKKWEEREMLRWREIPTHLSLTSFGIFFFFFPFSL